MPATSSPPSTLSRVPVAKRKQLAATLGLFATLFVAVGAVAATGPATTVVRVFVGIALAVAVLLALMAWGVVHSVREQVAAGAAIEADRDLDALIDEALAAVPRRYGSLCNCGHDHDPTELHVTDADGPDACAHDGAGDLCSHDCADCVLASLRPSPNRTRADRLSS
ncbi:hypothetical protein [Jatrophihabitans endophyticus]|uniref:hypothetical protein n=1 Tax=Jatrophihabitans endophyticus TaxID=1206085 RepID=UPI0019F28AEE|nr:hypothetical protein [Jatrophihabitans endophyticus]MBE7190174.1 hypothetical protein [Jatrophihabitans endophyticus]